MIPQPEILKGNQPLLGLAKLDDQDMIVLDLYQRILGDSATLKSGFLVVFQSQLNTYGLTTATLPTMQDIPQDAIHPVPADYRDRDALGIASSMADIAEGDQQITFFCWTRTNFYNLSSK